MSVRDVQINQSQLISNKQHYSTLYRKQRCHVSVFINIFLYLSYSAYKSAFQLVGVITLIIIKMCNLFVHFCIFKHYFTYENLIFPGIKLSASASVQTQITCFSWILSFCSSIDSKSLNFVYYFLLQLLQLLYLLFSQSGSGTYFFK